MTILLLTVLVVLILGMISVFGERSGRSFVTNIFGGAALFMTIPLFIWGSFVLTHN